MQAHDVLVGAGNLQALHVQHQVDCRGVETGGHGFERDVGFHHGNDWVAAYIFNGKRELVRSCFRPQVTDAERRGALRYDKGELRRESPVECSENVKSTTYSVRCRCVTNCCNFNIH